MKKLLALAAVLFASAASAQVSATPHNMANYAGAGAGDVCYYCHVAHNGSATAPLWGRNAGAALTPYTSATVTAVAVVDGVSAACMSCHDGVTDVALTIKQDFNGATVTVVGAVNANANIGTSLANDHPVSMTWNAAKAGLAATPFTGTVGATGLGGFVYYGAGSNQITCATCHAVHNHTNPSFLRVNPTAGNFCASCHSNK